MWQGSTHPLIFMDDVLDKQSTSMVNEGLCERGSTAKIIKCDRKLACSKTRCLHSGSPPAQGQSKPVRTTGRQTEVSSSIKSPLESLGLRHLLLKKGVFCQLRRQQISDNFNGVKAFIYTQTWSIKSVRQRGGLFFLQLKHTRPPRPRCEQCAKASPLDQEKKHFHTKLEKYSFSCQYVALRNKVLRRGITRYLESTATHLRTRKTRTRWDLNYCMKIFTVPVPVPVPQALPRLVQLWLHSCKHESHARTW